MKCVNFCLLGSALLGSSIASMATSKNSGNFLKFKNLLDENQRQIYKKIHNERLTIYIQGLVLGTLLGFLVNYKKNRLPKSVKTCLFVTIALGTTWMFYTLYPKSTYMLLHLTTPEQNAAWLDIYKEMKMRCHIGLILGALGHILMGMGLCM